MFYCEAGAELKKQNAMSDDLGDWTEVNNKQEVEQCDLSFQKAIAF